MGSSADTNSTAAQSPMPSSHSAIRRQRYVVREDEMVNKGQRHYEVGGTPRPQTIPLLFIPAEGRRWVGQVMVRGRMLLPWRSPLACCKGAPCMPGLHRCSPRKSRGRPRLRRIPPYCRLKSQTSFGFMAWTSLSISSFFRSRPSPP